ncbi:MAG TPA: hypothetical protein DCQ16_07245 [Spirochaetaceae bacterium]|nr:hypothetical protein [Spirochaetaceae bacterium]
MGYAGYENVAGVVFYEGFSNSLAGRVDKAIAHHQDHRTQCEKNANDKAFRTVFEEIAKGYA